MSLILPKRGLIKRRAFLAGLIAAPAIIRPSKLLADDLPLLGVGTAKVSVAGGTVTPQNTGLYAEGNPATTFNYTGLTVGAGSNLGIVAFVYTLDGSAITSATWDPAGANQAMTNIGSVTTSGGASRVTIFALRNPAVGNKTLQIINTANLVACISESFAGVNQTSDAAAFGTPSTATNPNLAASTPLTVTLSSNTGHYTAAGLLNQGTATWTATNGGSAIDQHQHFITYAAFMNAGANPNQTIGAQSTTNGLDVALIGFDISP